MPEALKKVDAVIIGAGVIGCAIAWRLAQANFRTIVIDRGEVGAEASHAAGGMLAPLSEADSAGDFFNLCVAGRAMYADFARELQEASGIDIEFRTEGTLYLALNDHDEEELDRRWEWQRAAGLNVKRLNRGCTLKLEPRLNPDLRWALKFPDDHQVNNRIMAAALHQSARSAGAEFITQCVARRVQIESVSGIKRVTGVLTDQGFIQSDVVVVAAGAWSSLLEVENQQIMAGNKIKPVRGQMIAVEMPSSAINHVVYSCRGYLVPRLGGLLIAGSTTESAGFDKRVTAGGINAIIQHAVEIFSGFDQLSISEIWAGLRPCSKDDLPVLGLDPGVGGLLYATGHYRNGILLTPITARVISELVIRGQSSIDLKPFSITRFLHPEAAG